MRSFYAENSAQKTVVTGKLATTRITTRSWLVFRWFPGHSLGVKPACNNELIKLGGNKIDVVHEYTYLGIVFNYNVKYTNALKKHTYIIRQIEQCTLS